MSPHFLLFVPIRNQGQVPPYAMPQIRGFAVQEGIVQTVKAAVDAYGLKALAGRYVDM
jgi:hypothetical protein